MRRRSGRAREFVLFGGLTLASALVAASGEPWGFIGLLFFGGGGVVYLVLSRPPRGTTRSLLHGTLPGAERHTASPVGIVFPASRGYAAFGCIGAAIFVVVGSVFLLIAMSAFADPPAIAGPAAIYFGVVGAVSVAFFGLVGVITLGPAVGRRGGIALLPEGVYVRWAGSGWVRWDDLSRSSVLGARHGGPQLALSGRSPGAVTLRGLQRWLRPINRRLFSVDVAIPLQTLRVPPQTLVGALQHYRRNPSERARLSDPSTADVESFG
jgi:hypothetical protein